MKKLRLLIFVFAVATLLSACQSGESRKSIITNFSADFTAKRGDFSAGGSIVECDGETELIFTDPQTVSGLKIVNGGGEIAIEIDDLVSTADEAYLPNENMPQLIHCVATEICDGREILFQKIINQIHIYWKLQKANAHIRLMKTDTYCRQK